MVMSSREGGKGVKQEEGHHVESSLPVLYVIWLCEDRCGDGLGQICYLWHGSTRCDEIARG